MTAEPQTASGKGEDSTPSATTTATPAADASGVVKRDLAPKVEEATEE